MGEQTAQSATPHTGQDAAQGAAPRSFIEMQWPVSKLSKESYNERKAVAGQTLTATGKWWGRKPLVLVRAIILGLLLPATDDPEADRETFLALMTMDDDGMLARLDGVLTAQATYEMCTPRERTAYFEVVAGRAVWKKGFINKADRQHVMRRAFLRLSYDERLRHCRRPEEIAGPSADAWARINTHLGTHAASLRELVADLGRRRFGAVPRIGDVFSGGGSIPFEAARLGCVAYGSDLNPVAALLTWGALNIVGGGEPTVDHLAKVQGRVFKAVQARVDAWGIERNEEGWIADAYLYCVEALDPATGWRVPLAPSWVIASKPNVVARLVPDRVRQRFDIEIVQDASAADVAAAAAEGTSADSGVRCPVDRDGAWLKPAERQTTSAERLRGARGLRQWENEDLVPRPDDVLGERLYCIRWYDPDSKRRYYRAPTEADLRREQRVLDLLHERFATWQATGVLPSRRIEPGEKTDEPIQTRGWTHWHHLFHPRQLLLTGLFVEEQAHETLDDQRALLLLVGRMLNWNSRLTIWAPSQGGGIGGGKNTFYNQALNPLLNYSCRPMATLESTYLSGFTAAQVCGSFRIDLSDARSANWNADIWITDPGYGDVILYDELSEYFLAWYDQQLPRLFPGWYSDSKRALTVKGEGAQFRTILAECYCNTTQHLREDGFQVVMFTHQDPEVWADLTLVLWAAGLQVSAAWTIATETGASGIKQGNYVQGTVILVLRKRQGDARADLADVFPDVQAEVRRQVRSMLALDPKDDPNFGDTDYQLAAYAAALRVLTAYSTIGGMDVERELHRTRARGETSPVTALIERAVRIASDELVPPGLDAPIWRKLGPEERLFLKGIAVEARGDTREGVYQELARGYGAADYRQLLASKTANQVRLKTPSTFAARDMRSLGAPGFAGTLLRHVLFAIYTAANDPERGPLAARTYLRQEVPGYWDSRATIIALLRYLHATPAALPHWAEDVKAAQLVLGSIENDAI
jgi:adenine-specific DNA methylase